MKDKAVQHSSYGFRLVDGMYICLDVFLRLGQSSDTGLQLSPSTDVTFLP